MKDHEPTRFYTIWISHKYHRWSKFVNTGVKCYVNNYDDCKPKVFSRRWVRMRNTQMYPILFWSSIPSLVLERFYWQNQISVVVDDNNMTQHSNTEHKKHVTENLFICAIGYGIHDKGPCQKPVGNPTDRWKWPKKYNSELNQSLVLLAIRIVNPVSTVLFTWPATLYLSWHANQIGFETFSRPSFSLANKHVNRKNPNILLVPWIGL